MLLPPLYYAADAVLEGEELLLYVLVGGELHAVEKEDGHTNAHQNQQSRHPHAGGKHLRNAALVFSHTGQLDEADRGEDAQGNRHGYACRELSGQVQEGVGFL